MPNYSLVANSTFKPFTYQELAMPLDRQEAYHEKLAEEYDNLSSLADRLEAMGTNDRDKNSRVYNQYKAYSDSLKREADELYRHGLNTESRQRLTDLRRRYNQEIIPIQNAWNKREEEAKTQQEALMKNPNLRFTRIANDTSLQDYIDNPQGGYGVIDLNTIAAQMSEMTKNLAKQAREARKEGIDAYTYRLITPFGLDPNVVNDWQYDSSASPELTNMSNQILAANGLDNPELLNTPNGRSILNEAIGAIQRGAWNAVGEDKEHILEDYGRREALREYNIRTRPTKSGNDNNNAQHTNLNVLSLRANRGKAGKTEGDTYESPEYDRQIPSTYGERYKEQMLSAAGTGKKGRKELSIVEFDGENGWKEVKKVNAADLKDYKVTNVRYNTFGNTAILQKDGEEPIRVRIPEGINTAAERNVKGYVSDATILTQAINGEGLSPALDEKGRFIRDNNGNIVLYNESLSSADKQALEEIRRKILDDMNLYGSQIVVPSETENEKYKPFGY